MQKCNIQRTPFYYAPEAVECEILVKIMLKKWKNLSLMSSNRELFLLQICTRAGFYFLFCILLIINRWLFVRKQFPHNTLV